MPLITSGKLTVPQFAGVIYAPAGVAATAGLKLGIGVAPTSPEDGDVWPTTAGIYARINGVTKQLDLAGTTSASDLTSGTLPNARLTGAYTGVTGLGTLAADLLFTDASYDIGKSSATRPRDGFFSRNVAVGGTLTATGLLTAGEAGLQLTTVAGTTAPGAGKIVYHSGVTDFGSAPIVAQGVGYYSWNAAHTGAQVLFTANASEEVEIAPSTGYSIPSFKSAGNGAYASGEAGMWLLHNNGTTVALRRVSADAADTQGTGYRALRITN